MAPKVTKIEMQDISQVALGGFHRARADAFTTTVLASMVMKAKKIPVSVTSSTRRRGLRCPATSACGWRTMHAGRKFLNRWAEWNVMLGYNEARMKASLKTLGIDEISVDRFLLAQLMDKTVTVIGAGIVGVCCALHLQTRRLQGPAHRKRASRAKAASFGNFRQLRHRLVRALRHARRAEEGAAHAVRLRPRR